VEFANRPRKDLAEMTQTPPNDFERAASQSQESLIGEFFTFLKHNKKWWLLPIILVMLMLGVLIYLSGTAAAPFIYTLF
jgi:hypothetical protein